MGHIHELKDFSASAFILHPTEPKLCLLKHKKIGKWLQPGGHVVCLGCALNDLTTVSNK